MQQERERGGGADMLGCSSRALQDRRAKPQAEQPQKCPRCDSLNTKFCYYNNYSLSQPRYFCKTCRRYWTRGGTLRNVPVGGGCRKKKPSSKRATEPLTASPSMVHDPEPVSSPPAAPVDPVASTAGSVSVYYGSDQVGFGGFSGERPSQQLTALQSMSHAINLGDLGPLFAHRGPQLGGGQGFQLPVFSMGLNGMDPWRIQQREPSGGFGTPQQAMSGSSFDEAAMGGGRGGRVGIAGSGVPSLVVLKTEGASSGRAEWPAAPTEGLFEGAGAASNAASAGGGYWGGGSVSGGWPDLSGYGPPHPPSSTSFL
ncbi:hypothetical protein AMTRI_Chr02g258090 [Amborella trichopoda]